MAMAVDAILRAEGNHAAGASRARPLQLICVIAAGGFVQGVVMGSHGGISTQVVYSGLKVPLLLCVSAAVCMPSFYVLNALLGLRADFAAAFRGVLAAQAAFAVSLAALAPLVALAYASSDRYLFAIVLNGGVFAVSTSAGQLLLSKHYRRLIAVNPRHRLGLGAWLSLHVFVAIQLAWVLRPFVGVPGLAPRFFREDAWSNAYVIVARIVWRFFSGQ